MPAASPNPSDAVDPLTEMVRRLGGRCEKPDAAMCAKLWEADHQRNALLYNDEVYGTKLADEFNEGCYTIDAVAEALIDARRERDEARARCAELEALCKQAASVMMEAAKQIDEMTEEPWPESPERNMAARLRAAAEKERGA